MKRHGTSHAPGFLLCSIASGIIVEAVKRSCPGYIGYFNSPVHAINFRYRLQVRPDIIAILLIGIVPAFIWGIGFKLMHRD